MIERLALSAATALVADFPAVAILGPRQVGKTTLALEIAEGRDALYLDLESEADRAKLAEPELFLREHQARLVILDEIHRVPEIFQTLRGLIDEGRRTGYRSGRFIILGSAAIDLLRQTGETLAGRIAYCELFPLNLLEITSATDRDPQSVLWLRGGFPDAFLARSDRVSLTWRRDFIKTYLQRDIPQFGPRIAEETLRRFWTMLAHLHGGILNMASLSRSLGVDNKTVANYLDLMVDLLLVRRLEPWHANTGKRLVKSPKVYVRDSGLMHALLQIETREALLGHPKLGDSWEGFVVENLLAVAPEGTEAHFYRTSAGAEIDLVLRFGAEKWAIEIKHTHAPKVSRGFHLACDDIAPTQRFIVHAGRDRFPVAEGIDAIPLMRLMERLNSEGEKDA
ncbi:MAG: ATP-binding protein [Nitratireductor sp.]|nr:ATP-binding protein [Nitratireductor sp.]MCB1455992.1 ATP-binding protein [Nitratireductor sp.]